MFSDSDRFVTDEGSDTWNEECPNRIENDRDMMRGDTWSEGREEDEADAEEGDGLAEAWHRFSPCSVSPTRLAPH